MMSNHPVECLHEDKWDYIERTLSKIETQTTATNGRIRALESWRIGFMASLATMGGIIVAIAGVLGPKLAAILSGLAVLEMAKK
jgi:hypothetical protein